LGISVSSLFVFDGESLVGIFEGCLSLSNLIIDGVEFDCGVGEGGLGSVDGDND